MQSGLLRNTISGVSMNSPVVHVSVDSLNKVLVTVTQNGIVSFDDFYSGKHISSIDSEVGACRAELHASSGLLAIATDSLNILVFDINLKKLVRQFKGNSSFVSDLAFTGDGRWLISSSSDGSIRVWDIPSGALIDCFRFSHSVTSIAVSPDSSFFATTHAESLGIYLWVNRSHYSNLYLKSVSNVPVEMEELEEMMIDDSKEEINHVEDGDDDDKEDENEISLQSKRFAAVGFVPYDSELVELSDIPRTKWQSIMYQEEIKLRNKPKEPVKAPKDAPFFLPTTKDVNPELIVEPQEDDDPLDFSTDKNLPLDVEFSLESRLLSCDGNYNNVTKYLKSLPPSTIDMQIRSVGFFELDDKPEAEEHDPDASAGFGLMLDYFLDQFAQPKNFEFCQACLNLFLRVHGSELCRSRVLVEQVSQLQRVQETSWKAMDDYVNFNLSLLQFITAQKM